MPRLDGTGPMGLGPLTGQGEGYCAIAYPQPASGAIPCGYAGLAGRPVQLEPTPVFGRGRPFRLVGNPGRRVGGRRAGRRRGPARRY
jgi:hypothetical protein